MEMIVGLFNDSYPPVMDGVANTVKNYAYWINKKCGKCYVVTPKFPHYRDQDEFEVIRYASTSLPLRAPYRLGIPSIAFYSKYKLKQIDFDLIHVHCPFSSGHLALKLAQKKNIPTIATFHSKFYDDFKQVFKNDMITKLMLNKVVHFYEKVDYVWTVNERTAETLRSYGYKKKIEIMPNGTDFISSIDENDLNEFMEKAYHITEGDLVFLFVGQHIWQKNIKLIIEALNLLKSHHIKFKMFFIGDGYAKKDLEDLVNKYHLSNEVMILGKITDRNKLKLFFARADLFIFPSVYDNAPIVIREAAALKTPSIVIDGSNAQEGIIDFENGFTCLESALSLAKKIETVIKDKKVLKIVGENAKNTIALPWENIVDKVSNRYQEIITTH